MHGQGNYTTQVGQGPYPSPPAFQQHPAITTHPGPRPPQQQFIQPQFTPGILPHQHAIPNVASQGPPSTGMSSAQSYLSHPQPPQAHVSNQMSHSYQTSEQQRSWWSQNVHHLPPPPPRGPSAYPTPSQAPSHALPPPPPHYSSSSSFSMSEPFGSSALSIRQHSYLQSVGPLPPPPPRPPPAPPASPPRVPPLPSSSPLSDTPAKNDGNDSLKGLLDGENLMLERPILVKNVEDRHVHQIEVTRQHTEDCEPKVESVDAAAHSPADSDMDMEDDITHPDEEKMNCLSNNSNDELISISQENYEKEQKPLQHTGGQRLPKVAQDGNALLAEVSVTKDQRGGSGIMTDSDFPTTRKVSSEADNLGMIGQTEHPLDSSVNTSSQQHKEGADTFKLLQGYASDTNSENEGEDLLRDLSPPPANDRSPPSDGKKILSRSITETPKNVSEADESSFATGKLDKFSHKSHRGQKSKGSSRNSDAKIGPDGANVHKTDTNSNSTKLNVDEFGRLIREGVSDSDTSDSSRHARRSRKRSRCHSRSRSPYDRRRRRSPRRRNERRGRSRSFSPKRRRSRSRSPVLRRDSEFSGDKSRRAKSQLPECFDFLRGKCYRGAACRYSHHESDKSERSRYNRGRQQYPDLRESKVLPDKEVKDNFPQDMPVLKDVKDAKDLLDHSAYSARDMPSGKQNSMVSESPAQYSDKIPQIVDQARGDSVISESLSLLQASAATSTHLPADKDAKQDPFDPKSGPTSQLHYVGSPIMKSNSTSQPDAKQLNLNSSSASQVMNAPFPQPIMRDCNFMPYQAPVAYQHPHFPALLNSLSTTFLPPPPPRSHLAVNVTTGEHSLPSENMQQSSVPPQDSLSSYTSMRNQPTELANQFQSQYQRFPLAHEPDQMQHTTYNSGSGGPHIMREDRFNGNPRQAMTPLQPFSQAQPNSLLMQPSRTTPDFIERNRPSYVGDFQGSRIPNHFNPYALTFDLPLSSKFSSNALIQENDSTVNTKYSAPVDLSSVNVNANKIEIIGSKNMIPSTESVLPRPGADQYDPLFDSLEPASTSFSRADHLKYENTGDSDNMMRFSGLNMEGINQNGATAVSANDFVEKEECGETADAEVGAVLNLSPSDPNDDATDDTNEGEIEIDQVKVSGKKKKGKDSRSTRLFKISIATFVKEVLKPSWRQGNMSKEAFKTIVKKTVDKVSGAMKSHKIPKSQAKINHYIDSSRGKLTKLVMGYVDKYVKA